MIQNPISIEAASEISVSLLTKLTQTTNLQGVVAGGFLRDAFCGKVAKDVDIYISTPGNLTDEQLDAKAKAFYDALGHEFHLHKRVDAEITPPPAPRPGRRRLFEAAEPNGGYPMVLRVYSSTKQPEDHYPVDLVFTPVNMFHPFIFDMNICNIHISATGRLHASQAFNTDVINKTITLAMLDDPIAQEMRNWAPLDGEKFDRSYTRLVNHIERVKAKYDDHRLVFDAHFLSTPDGTKTFTRMIEEGIIGDPGTFFQAKRQEPIGDEVRLEDGAEAVPDVDSREARRAAASAALNAMRTPDWINPFGDMETATGRLFGGAPVQAGPDVIVYDEAGD